jgi:lysophospholipase
LFFSELDAFIQSLPSQRSLRPTQSTDPQFKTILNSYLDHYDLQLANENIAKSSCIWAANYGLSLGSTATPKHYTIVQQHWQTNGNTQGTVVIVHGYLDHTGLYGRAIRWALTQGYDVLSFDLPGHGLSSGEAATITHFDQYSDVLRNVSTQHSPALAQPLIALGQSTGCAVICRSLLKNAQQENTSPAVEEGVHNNPAHAHLFSRVILLAPLVRSYHWKWLRYIYYVLRPHITSIQRKFVHSSHNKPFNAFIKDADPLQASHIPLLWLGAMDQWYQSIKNTSQTCALPLTIIQGTGDTTVDWHYNIPALTRIFPNSHTHYIQDAQHHLVNEAPEYWQTIEEYLTQQVQKP